MARQQVVIYSGHYANSTGNLNRDLPETEPVPEQKAPTPIRPERSAVPSMGVDCR